MLGILRNIGVLFTSVKGWLIAMSSLPAISVFVSGFFDPLPWGHKIALMTLALAGGAVFVVCLITIWEKLGGNKQAALLALGTVWEDGANFRNDAMARPPPLTQEDKEKIKDFHNTIVESVGIISKPEQSFFRKINTFNKSVHPAEVQVEVRGDKELIIFCELLLRVGNFIDKHTGVK